VFLDVAIYSKEANGGDVHVQFVDWIPLICNILGMLMSTPPSTPTANAASPATFFCGERGFVDCADVV
jgi:Uncharacterised protein family (UPF0220)